MKFAICCFLLFTNGCKFQDNKHLAGEQTPLKALVTEKIESFIDAFDGPSPFCQAILQNSPTREDFIRNWQPDGEQAFCPGESPLLASCQKKDNDAFAQGLLCFNANFFNDN